MVTWRVLVVDDAVVMRRLVSQALEDDPALTVAGTAANGRIALAKLDQVNPDAVVLDVEMPEMDGLATLRELRARGRDLPVVMFSTLTERGASTTLEAMALGASDYVTKPANVGSVTESLDRVRTELAPRITALCEARARVVTPSPVPTRIRHRPAPQPKVLSLARQQRIDLLAIGASTGGPNALHELLPALPGDLPVPVVICQHMPPVFTRLLAQRLDAQCALRVREAVDGACLAPGEVWIAPGDHHLEVRNGADGPVLALHQGPPESSCRPAVDPLFRSVAATHGAHALGVVLTGMGQDGLRGCEHIREAGAPVLVQDEDTSVVWGMPGAVASAGLADEVLPLGRLAEAIVTRVSVRRALLATRR
jgi:two-component system, chemotaxis family, protein-glutamate methylesterase/glutaminase